MKNKVKQIILPVLVIILIGAFAIVYFLYQNKQTYTYVENQNLTIIATDKQDSIAIPKIFTGANWKEVPLDSSKSADYRLYYDNLDYPRDPQKQKFLQLSGRLWEATFIGLSDLDFYKKLNEFAKNYEISISLKNLGWESRQDIQDKKMSVYGLSDDSESDSLWSYVKVRDNSLRLIGLGHQTTNYTDASSGGETRIACPCDLKLTVFVSDIINLDQLSL